MTITKTKTHTIKRVYTELGANGVMMFHECIDCGERADESLDLIGEACRLTEPAAILGDIEAVRNVG